MPQTIRTLIRLTSLACVVLLGAPLLPAIAQDATPLASPVASSALTTNDMTVAAGGLLNPRGFAWNSLGALYVAQAGIGGDTVSSADVPVVQVVGNLMGGKTASVARIDAGCPAVIAPNLASTRDEGGVTVGAAAVAFLDDQLYVLIAGGGEAHGNPEMPNGVYRVNADTTVTLVADLGAFIRANPVEAGESGDYSPEGDPYALAPDVANNALWMLEANSGQLLRASLDGTITRLADFSEGDQVPTALAVDPAGGVYVGFLTPVPFVDGSSRVVHVSEDGEVTEVWTGLTMVTAVAVGPDGSLYALEFSTGNTAEPPFLVPGTGKIVKQTGPSTMVDVATGLNMPAFMDFGPDGNLYISLPGIGANDANGVILMTDLVPGSAPAAPPVCTVATPDIESSPVPEASPFAN